MRKIGSKTLYRVWLDTLKMVLETLSGSVTNKFLVLLNGKTPLVIAPHQTLELYLNLTHYLMGLPAKIKEKFTKLALQLHI